MRRQNQKSDPVCADHKLPIIKIQTQTKRLICEKCLQENDQNRKLRLQIARAELTNLYTTQLEALKAEKADLDKMVEMLMNQNMVEAKRKIKKELIETQKGIEGLLQQQIREGNRTLKKYVEEELKGWEGINGSRFELGYVEFDKELPRMQERVREKKQEIKKNIKMKMKKQIRNLFQKMFNF